MESPESKQCEELAWRIGGPQGSGIDRLATVFGRTCARFGLHIFSRREYHSNIIGRHSYVDCCISSQSISSHQESPDILVTFEAESLCRHLMTMAAGSQVLYAADNADVSLDSLPFLDAPLKENLRDILATAEQPATTAGLLEIARQRGVQILAIPYSELLTSLASEFDLSRKQASRAINTLAVAASTALLGFTGKDLISTLEIIFGQDHQLLKLNASAVNKAYEFIDQLVIQQFTTEQKTTEESGALVSRPWLHKQRADHKTLYINGCQSVALGKLAAGLTFQTYYPISPASDESIFLEELDPIPLTNGNYTAPLIQQVEDEIAAATMACGAALTGARSATSTSGPGFCLMTESLGWAGMNEVPLVVSLYQRGGPSTGLPTRSEQGDLQFAIHAGHSEFPRLVMASGDVEDCFYDSLQAFNYAERYQLPVIHMLDKALASSSQTLSHFHYEDIKIDRGDLYSKTMRDSSSVERFALTSSGITPRPLVGQHQAQHWLTGAEHDTFGQVSENTLVREQMMEKRMGKLEKILADLSQEEKLRIVGNEKARLTVLTWGSTKGAVWDAVKRLLQNNVDIRAIQVRLLWPFPADALAQLLTDANPLVVVEGNYSGQLNNLLGEHIGRSADHLLIKYNGRPMSGDALFAELLTIHAGNGTSRCVLRNPYE